MSDFMTTFNKQKTVGQLVTSEEENEYITNKGCRVLAGFCKALGLVAAGVAVTSGAPITFSAAAAWACYYAATTYVQAAATETRIHTGSDKADADGNERLGKEGFNQRFKHYLLNPHKLW
jgi:hypothetical protein